MTSYAILTSVAEGLVLGLVCLGVFISFRILQFPDLTCDGSYALGACVGVALVNDGCDPFVGLLFVAISGALAGSVVAFLHIAFKVPAVVASILVMTAAYSVNLLTLGGHPIASIQTATPSLFQTLSAVFEKWHLPIATNGVKILFLLFFSISLIIIITLFLRTKLGLGIQTTGSNPQAAVSQAVSTSLSVWLGLALANGIIALGGGVYAQLNRFADVNMGIGTIVAALAGVFIGQAIERFACKKKHIARMLLLAVIGAVLYRFSLAITLALGIPNSMINLMSSVIVCLAVLSPSVHRDIERVLKRGT